MYGQKNLGREQGSLLISLRQSLVSTTHVARPFPESLATCLLLQRTHAPCAVTRGIVPLAAS